MQLSALRYILLLAILLGNPYVTQAQSAGSSSDSVTFVKDAKGNLYTINAITGQATHIGKASDGKPAGTLLFDAKTIASDRAVAVFESAETGKYAFDTYNPKYAESLLFSEKYEELRTYGSEAYQVPFKLIPAGATDVVQVTVTRAELQEGFEMKAIDPDKIVFRTAAGAEYKPKVIEQQDTKTVFELTLPSTKANDGYELYALHPMYAANSKGYKYDMLGKLTVVSYSIETPKVVLVAVNGNTAIDQNDVKAYIDKVYLLVGINWQVGEITDFTYNIPRDSLDVLGSGMFSRYTPTMKQMNAAFMQRDDYDPATLYIFVLQRASQDNTSGDMPRGCQFGYIFTGAITDAAKSGMSKNEIIGRTIAHELGHGMFKLKHTFDSEYRIAQSSTENVMDYSWGTDYVKHQWDAIHEPGLVIGMFERDEDAMNVIAPTQFVVTYKDTNLQINDTIFILNGFHQSIVLKTVKQIENKLISNKITWIIRDSEQKSDSLTVKIDEMTEENLVIEVKTTAVLGKVYQTSVTLIKLRIDPERKIIRTLEELLEIEELYNNIVLSIDQAIEKLGFDPFLIKGNNNRYVSRGMNKLFEKPGENKTDNIIDGLFRQLYATDLLMEIYEGNFEKMVEKVKTIIQKDSTGMYQTKNNEFIQKVISQINEIQHKDIEKTEQMYQEAIKEITLKQLVKDE